ncbi:vanillate O-demethylase oxidoreductase (Vanillate degradation ferredoxin-like protein) [Bradyrhizobium sp. ORS 278]|uniref:PDR/VanB family oxidoreductase n=1 Tax=Bradyrhizobium sp. (strain ORS 278) TaxID=114615 RepID=UPI0001507C10|nr:PDR/VanB family oxidoreductase [Bradyrhizobium sp. ORS 278]CAL75722.1 vanillate O-demethylase oxidoreductase (Vanillate degradation ferredoxin-like protein) [Bradyrhizobium sp. ORS 278]
MSDSLHTVVVARKAIEAHNMASFELVPADDQPLPGFTPGSHIDVTLPNGLTRQYSLLNSATERDRYCIGVWKDANSRGGSKALHLDVNEGDRLQVSRPRNRFKIPKDIKRALLVARGIGVTPILSIADTLKAKKIPFELHYVFALMSPDSFRGTIEASSFADNTTYYKEATEDNQLLKAADLLADRPDDTELFICGVDWWMDPIIALAKQKGFAEERIHVERFTAKAAAALLDKVFDVTIKSTGATFKIPGDKTVTAFLEENGVKIATSCEQGMCGTCKTKVVDGDIDHRDKRLSAAQRAEGYFLPCVSRAKGDRLVLDL